MSNATLVKTVTREAIARYNRRRRLLTDIEQAVYMHGKFLGQLAGKESPYPPAENGAIDLTRWIDISIDITAAELKEGFLKNGALVRKRLHQRQDSHERCLATIKRHLAPLRALSRARHVYLFRKGVVDMEGWTALMFDDFVSDLFFAYFKTIEVNLNRAHIIKLGVPAQVSSTHRLRTFRPHMVTDYMARYYTKYGDSILHGNPEAMSKAMREKAGKLLATQTPTSI